METQSEDPVRRRSLFAATLALFAVSSVSLVASAKNAIQIENERPVDPSRDNWLPQLDPVTYEAKNIGINGTIDGYPSRWSYKHGDALGLRVSTTAGSFNVTATVTDGALSSQQLFTWLVRQANVAPSLVTPASQTSIEGDTILLQMQASDLNGDTLTFSITNRPSWATF